MTEDHQVYPTGAPAIGARAAGFVDALGIVRVTTAIAASPSRIFDALKDPTRLAVWWRNDGARLHCRATPRRGGDWRLLGSRDEHAEPVAHGRYLVVDPPRVLAYTCLAARHDFLPTVVRCEIAAADVRGMPGARVVVTQTGFAGRLEAGRLQADVWLERLGRLSAQLEESAD